MVIASGEALPSQAWAEVIASGLAARGLDSRPPVLQYHHWQDTSREFNLQEESLRLGELARAEAAPYSIFAKSIGTIVTLNAVRQGLVMPRKIIMVGTPYEWVKQKYPLTELLEGYKVPTLFVQATDDPAGRYEGLEELLKTRGVENYQTLEVPGANHGYPDVDLVCNVVMDFIH